MKTWFSWKNIFVFFVIEVSCTDNFFLFFSAYSVFFITGLVLSMQVPFVGFQPIRTSEHMAAAGKVMECFIVVD